MLVMQKRADTYNDIDICPRTVGVGGVHQGCGDVEEAGVKGLAGSIHEFGRDVPGRRWVGAALLLML